MVRTAPLKKAVRWVFLFWGAIVLLGSGCATRPATPPTRSGPTPCDNCIAGVSNFSKVSPVLWRGAQPTEEGFRNLEAAGAKTIISLREHHDDFHLIGGTKLNYLRIPMDAWDPEEAELVLFLTALERILKDPDSTPVFVHCAAGKDRTGYAMAAYRMVFENWTAEDAIHEMFDFRFNTVWFRNPGFLKKMDVARVRTLMRLAP